MSEVHARGRGSARGGRGGHAFRGGRGGARVSKSAAQDSTVSPSFEEEGELGQLKRKYQSELSMLKELFPDWTDEDLVFAMEDAGGDLETAIERISEGNVSQWGEVKKKHTERPRTKPKEAVSTPNESAAPSSRGGRPRGGFEGRGRARGDRGRGGRGGRAGAAHVNGTRAEKPSVQVPAASESTHLPPDSGIVDSATKEAPDNAVPETAKPTTEQPQKSSLIPEGTKKGWASLFAKPAPPPPQSKPLPPVVAVPVSETVPESFAAEQPSDQHLPPHETHAEEITHIPETGHEPQLPVTHIEPQAETAPALEPHAPVEVSQAPASVGAAVSTTDEHVVQPPQQQQPLVPVPLQEQLRPAVPYPPGAAYKTTPGRSHFQRRLLDQQEAVVMPGNHAVDRATVQFGSMGLNGTPVDLDIDEHREDPETRPQPPQHSPNAPRASLPPSTRAPIPTESVSQAPRAAPGLPPVPPTTANESFNDFGRYGDLQKPYDPFGQQAEPQPHPPSHEPFANQAALPSQPTATTGADYSAFYGADQSRNPYYYGYGQQEPGNQRVASGFSATTEAQVQPPSTQAPARYGPVEAAANSGQNTPNPTLPGQSQPSQPTHMPQGQGHGGAFNYGYPYYSNPHYPSSYQMGMGQQHQYGRNRPMYDDARRYEEQYLPHTSQFGYGSQYGAPYGKGGMYGQPGHGYSYEHSSSPANAGGFNPGAAPARDSGYGRTGSAQPTEGQQSSTGTTFGSIPDVFGRTQFGQTQPSAAQQPNEEAPKPFEAPKAGGPSPSVAHAHRPGSAANNPPAQPAASQPGLPPIPAQQGSQQGFGNYPHLNPPYGGLGGLGTHHQTGGSQSHHQQGGYGNYGAGFGSNYYGNTGRGGGWGGNYGH